jgi:hypothetical protein
MDVKRRIFESIAAILFATASLAHQVKTDYDSSANFSQYKTYFWEKVRETQGPLWIDRIKEAVNATLTAKGLTPVESGGDVAIVAIKTTQNQRTVDTFYDGSGGGWRWREGAFEDASTTIDTYKVGTLVVDLFDAHQDVDLAWIVQ